MDEEKQRTTQALEGHAEKKTCPRWIEIKLNQNRNSSSTTYVLVHLWPEDLLRLCRGRAWGRCESLRSRKRCHWALCLPCLTQHHSRPPPGGWRSSPALAQGYCSERNFSFSSLSLQTMGLDENIVHFNVCHCQRGTDSWDHTSKIHNTLWACRYCSFQEKIRVS